ncbi:MAG: S-layer homology domain-containing protein [Oscillospiraceae bacterium]|nr:S-layer homology domain-containing protein [Oscillospiraceae bacterium]
MCVNFKNIKNKIKKLYVFLFSLIILTVLAGSVFIAAAIDYENHWARPVFDDWIRLGILKPDSNGDIHPDDPISRGELSSYINKIMGYSTPADISKYTDTPRSTLYYWDMAVATGVGYMAPTSANTLSPAAPMTREQVISAFAKVAQIPESPTDLSVLSWVNDASQISNDKLNDIASSIVNGFIAGQGGYSIQPKEYMSVSEVIVLLDRLNSGKRVYAFPGTYGPQTGNIVSNYTTIMSTGVNLNNANVSKDLDIHSDTGEGDVYLTTDSIAGTFFVNGGKNIYMSKVTAGEIQINKTGAHLVYTADSGSNAGALVINGDNAVVDINRGNTTQKIIINGKNATINVGENVKINDLSVYGDNATVNLAVGARLENVTLNAKTQINGQGTIGTLNVNPGGDGSVIDPKPDKTNIADGTNVTIDNKSAGSSNPKVIGGSFLFPVTLKVNTDDTTGLIITKNDFKIAIDGSQNSNFTVSTVSPTEFNIILPVQISAYTQVTITGVNNLTGTVTISQASQPTITDAIPSDMKTINLTLTNPQGTAFSNANFQVQIAGKAVTGFMVTAQSPTSYNLIIPSSATIKSGQVITINGQNGLGGSVTVGAIAAVKAIVFEDNTRFLVNTDDTSGNKITADCFGISVGGGVTDFTVKEKSKTSYEITLTSIILTEGTTVDVDGKKYLSGQASSNYSTPFLVSKVNDIDKKNISIVLLSAPSVDLTTEKHADSFQVFVDNTRIPVTGITKDMTDKKNTTYNLMVDLSNMQGILTVNRVKESKNKGMVDFVDPVLLDVRMNDRYLNESPPNFRVEPASAKLIIEFSEPVFKTAPSTKFSNKEVALSGTVFNIITGTGSGFDPTGIKVAISANSVILDLSGAKRMDPGIYTLTIDKTQIFDAFGNPCGRNNPDKVSFKFDIIGSVPTVVSAAQNPTGGIDIKLNGSAADAFGTAMSQDQDTDSYILIMDGPTQKGTAITYQYISYDSKTKTLSINRDALPPNIADITDPNYLDKTTYKLIFTNPDFVHFEVSKIKIDTKRPEILNVSLKDTNLTAGNNGSIVYTQTDADGNPALDENGNPITYTVPMPKVSQSNATIQIEFSEPVFAAPPSAKFTASNLASFGQAFNVDADDSGNVDLGNAKLTSSNRTVTISLNSAKLLAPDRYTLTIDGGLIYDSVGNPVNGTDSSMLKYYFTIMRVPPVITSARQQTNGDIVINFSRYVLSTEYRTALCDDGVINIFDKNGNLIQTVSNEFLSADNVNPKLVIKREGLNPNIPKDNYTIELNEYDYATQTTSPLQIYTYDEDKPAITIGGNKKIPLTSNAEQNRVTVQDAIITVTFGGNIKNANGGKFTASDFAVTSDPSVAPFTLYVEDSNGAPISFTPEDLAKIQLTFGPTGISIDLTKAINDSMLYAKFTISVNKSMIYDTNGLRISNEVESGRFKLAKSPFPLQSAVQIPEDGGIVVTLSNYDTSDGTNSQSIDANTYGSYIDGTNYEFGIMSTVRFERNGIIVGYIPSDYIWDGVSAQHGVTYDFSQKTITISKSSLDHIIDLDGNPVKLDGGKYTLVLNHSEYADNKIDLTVDTTPPVISTGYPKANIDNTSGTTMAHITFKFNEDVNCAQIICTAEYKNSGINVNVEPVNPVNGYSNVVTVSFPVANNTYLSDYIITNLTVQDLYTNKASFPIAPETGICALPLSLHDSSKMSPGDSNSQIPGFEYDAQALTNTEDSPKFLFEESPTDFSKYYDPTTRKVTNNEFANILTEKANGATEVTLQSEMVVTIPDGVTTFRYTESKIPTLTSAFTFNDFRNVPSDKKIILHNEIKYTLDNGTWTVGTVQDSNSMGYYIFEWSTADKVYYTYVISDFVSSPVPAETAP